MSSRGTILITGVAGLVGSSVARLAHRMGYEVVGVDNDMRRHFFGPSATTAGNAQSLRADLSNYTHAEIDIRDTAACDELIRSLRGNLAAVVHTAAQPSHDWSATSPLEDFEINATATAQLLESARNQSPESAFVFTSTNKVYGDQPNALPMQEMESRWEIRDDHPFFEAGIDESLSLDQCLHSPFGVSKAAADLLVQEYGRYYGLPTTVLRLGCITGPAHRGAELHGFLSYLISRSIAEKRYTIYGYAGKQVRDNLHSDDLAAAILMTVDDAPEPGSVYNLGGGRAGSISVLEALDLVEDMARIKITREYDDRARIGDHIWWITNCEKFSSRYPEWQPGRAADQLIGEMVAEELKAREQD